jgi:4-hydroxybenzoate polyprenyltransferase
MMTTYDPKMKRIHNLKIVVVEILLNSKYNFNFLKFQESFVRCKWVIMCMTYKQSFGLQY